MTERVVLRAATAQEFDALMRCDSCAQSHDSRRDILQKAIAGGDCIAATVNDAPVGYVLVGEDFFRHSFVSALVVHPAFRRRNVGSQLLAAAESACKGNKLFTSTNASNRAAQQLFLRAGFERSGVIENLDEGDPELIFFKRVVQQDGTLRQATSADVEAMHALRMSVLENRLTSGLITRSDYVEHMEVLGRGWVCDVGGRVVAFGVCNAKTGNLWALFVLPDFERRGFGRLLLDTMVDWLWKKGLDRIWLTTQSSTRAQHFYEAAGWTNVGITEHSEIRFELQRSTARVA